MGLVHVLAIAMIAAESMHLTEHGTDENDHKQKLNQKTHFGRVEFVTLRMIDWLPLNASATIDKAHFILSRTSNCYAIGDQSRSG